MMLYWIVIKSLDIEDSLLFTYNYISNNFLSYRYDEFSPPPPPKDEISPPPKDEFLPPKDGNNLSAGALAGIIASVVVLGVLALLLLLWFIIRRMKNKKGEQIIKSINTCAMIWYWRSKSN